MTRLVGGLSEIAPGYDVLLCDVWGVIHNGRETFPLACAALARWRRERGPVVLISNSPRPWRAVVDQIDDLGVPREAWSSVVTSGDATRALLAARAPGPAWRIGPGRDDPLYAGLGLTFAPLEQANFIACTGPDDDENETALDYRQRLGRAAERGLEMVCANPDKVVQRGDRLIICGGALAELYQTLGGEVRMAGKPWPPIYDLALARAAADRGDAVDRLRVLAIGDGMATDITGANRQDLDALFIAGGIHGADELIDEGGLALAAVEHMLAENDARARFSMLALIW